MGICLEGLFNVVDSRERIISGVLPIRPHHDGMTKITEINSHEWMAKSIKHVDIFTGDVVLEACNEKVFVPVLEGELNTEYVKKLQKGLYSNQSALQLRCSFTSFLNSKLPRVKSLRVLSSEYRFAPSDSQVDYELRQRWKKMWSHIDDFSFRDGHTSPTKYLNILLAMSTGLDGPLHSPVLSEIPSHICTTISP